MVCFRDIVLYRYEQVLASVKTETDSIKMDLTLSIFGKTHEFTNAPLTLQVSDLKQLIPRKYPTVCKVSELIQKSKKLKDEMLISNLLPSAKILVLGSRASIESNVENKATIDSNPSQIPTSVSAADEPSVTCAFHHLRNDANVKVVIDGKIVHVQVDETWTIEELIDRICSMYHYQPSHLKLVSKGKTVLHQDRIHVNSKYMVLYNQEYYDNKHEIDRITQLVQEWTIWLEKYTHHQHLSESRTVNLMKYKSIKDSIKNELPKYPHLQQSLLDKYYQVN